MATEVFTQPMGDLNDATRFMMTSPFAQLMERPWCS